MKRSFIALLKGDATKRSIFCISLLGAAIGSSNALHAQQPQLQECLEWMETFSSSPSSRQPWSRVVNYFGTLVPTSSAPSYSELSQLTALRHNLLELQIEKLRLREILEAHVSSSASGSVQYGQAVYALPDIIRRTDEILIDLRTMSRNGSYFAAEDAFADLVFALDARKRAVVCNIEFPPGRSIPDQAYIASIIEALDEELAMIDSAETSLAEYVRKLRQ